MPVSRREMATVSQMSGEIYAVSAAVGNLAVAKVSLAAA